MPRARGKSSKTPARSRSLGRESVRAFCAGALLTSILAFAFFMGGGVQQQSASTAMSKKPGDEGDAPFRTAPILFIPFQGNDCKEHLFDNLNGRIWFFGYVDCAAAIARNAGTGVMVWSAARIDAVRGGFRGN